MGAAHAIVNLTTVIRFLELDFDPRAHRRT
jgi:hypothetical protein